MARPVPPYLKLRASEPAEAVRPDVADLACLGELCQAFAEATGWPLRYVPHPEPKEDFDLLWSAPVNPGVGETPGHLRIDLGGTTSADVQQRADWHATERMAGAIAELMNELVTSRSALWQREAELAASVPVTSHEDEKGHLAARLEATLRAGAHAIQCEGAALYLLDEATSELKLRSTWGLPRDKLAEPARPLADQLADLEALLGHAVALEGSGDKVGGWCSPEPAAAALCVPVSSPTVPLGTLWFFCERERPFSDEQTNIAEIVAGKIASDLERAVLIEQQTSTKDFTSQVAAVHETQQHQQPIAPPLVGWQVDGWSEQAGPLGGAFYDWRMLDDSTLLLMLGDACDDGLQAALAATALRAVLRATDDGKSAGLDEMMRRANRVLWENSAGNWWAGAWLGKLDLTDGRCQIAQAGRPTSLWLRPDGWESLTNPVDPLGVQPLVQIDRKPAILSPGEALVVCNRGVMETYDKRGRPLEEAAVARTLQARLELPPQQLIKTVLECLEQHSKQLDRRDRSILVVQRLPR